MSYVTYIEKTICANDLEFVCINIMSYNLMVLNIHPQLCICNLFDQLMSQYYFEFDCRGYFSILTQ